jgi:NAD dependent epimerase/dehydratase
MQIRKVFITGAGGFIGSHLAERCSELGYEVRAFIKYNSKNNWGWLDNSEYQNDMQIITGDIRDYDSVHNAMKGCDTVFHLAALISIPYSYISPLAFIKTNIEGTYNILESARLTKIENILITSTSETYGTAQYVPIDEKHPIVGQSPYAASKIAADELALSFYRSFDLPVKVVRPFNTYGPRQSARAIIPDIISQILNNPYKIKLGNLYPTRDFTFVQDTVDGFVEIAKCEKLFGEVTNIGMNKEMSISDLSKMIAVLLETDIKIVSNNNRERPYSSEVERLLCDNSKLLQNTNWSPRYDLTRGLEETIDWLRTNIHEYKADIYNI